MERRRIDVHAIVEFRLPTRCGVAAGFVLDGNTRGRFESAVEFLKFLEQFSDSARFALCLAGSTSVACALSNVSGFHAGCLVLLQPIQPATQIAVAAQQGKRVGGSLFMEEVDAVALLRRLEQPVDGPLATALKVILKEFT